MKRGFPLFFLFLFLLAACGPSAEQQATMTAAALTATAASWTSTPTQTATITVTPTPTITPTVTLTPTVTENPNFTRTPQSSRYYLPDSRVSLIPPRGWQPVGIAYPGLDGALPGFRSLTADIENMWVMLVLYKSSMDLPSSVKSWEDDIKQHVDGFIQVSEDALTTDEGENYVRWQYLLTDPQNVVVYNTVVYFFSTDGANLSIYYTRPQEQGAEYDVLVEESARSTRMHP